MIRAHMKARSRDPSRVRRTDDVAPASTRLSSSPVTVDCTAGAAAEAGVGRRYRRSAPDIPITGRRGRTKRAKRGNSTRARADADHVTDRAARDRVSRRLGELVRLCTAGRRRCDKGVFARRLGRDLRARRWPWSALWHDAARRRAAAAAGAQELAESAFGDRHLRAAAFVIARRRRPARSAPVRARGAAQLRACRRPRCSPLSRARPLQDILTCIRHGATLIDRRPAPARNDEHDLARRTRSRASTPTTPPPRRAHARRRRALHFSLAELRYRYPSERLPDGTTSAQYSGGWSSKVPRGVYAARSPRRARAARGRARR